MVRTYLRSGSNIRVTPSKIIDDLQTLRTRPVQIPEHRTPSGITYRQTSTTWSAFSPLDAGEQNVAASLVGFDGTMSGRFFDGAQTNLPLGMRISKTKPQYHPCYSIRLRLLTGIGTKLPKTTNRGKRDMSLWEHEGSEVLEVDFKCVPFVVDSGSVQAMSCTR